MKYFTGLLLLAFTTGLFTTKTYGQLKEAPKEAYIASNIPDSLKQDANSVVRYSYDYEEVKGPGKVTIKHLSVVTILNEKGDDQAIVQFRYNRKFDTYSYVDIKAFDKNGKQIKKYHKSDMYDGARVSYETLADDDRILGLKHAITNYPETISIEYEENISSIVNLGTWVIQDNEQSVQSANYNISIIGTAGFRYFNKNTVIKPVKTSNGVFDNYAWSVSNLKAIKLEEGAKYWKVLPIVEFAQDKFSFYGNDGDFSNWKNFGKWYNDLNTGSTALSPDRVAWIKKVTDTIKSEKEKAKFLYKYMQESMRYVSIQLGIGGMKAFPASFVDQKKYGDCKALSNYMRALLQTIGINSYCVIINAGKNAEPANANFPFDSFNHVILCIPFKNDTTWLECTSNNTKFGELTGFTENRNGLAVTEDGGKLISTPRSKSTENQFISESHITLNPDGSAKAHVMVKSTGEYRMTYIQLEAEKTDEQKQYWLKSLEIKQPYSFDLTPGKDINGIKQDDLDLEYDKFCDIIAGDKQFYKPAAFVIWDGTVPVLEKRLSDYYWDYPRLKTCTTTIDLPEGYEVETLPGITNLKFTYGSFDISYVYNKDKNQVVGSAKFELTNQVIPAAKYNEMQQFMDNVARAQNKKLVIKKKA